jgi:hypothetical protein
MSHNCAVMCLLLLPHLLEPWTGNAIWATERISPDSLLIILLYCIFLWCISVLWTMAGLYFKRVCIPYGNYLTVIRIHTIMLLTHDLYNGFMRDFLQNPLISENRVMTLQLYSNVSVVNSTIFRDDAYWKL